MDSHQTLIILDYGGQCNQLIARSVREIGVYTDLLPYSTPLSKLMEKNPIAIIFTGEQNSVFDPASITVDKDIINCGIPLLGINYGAHLLNYLAGGKISYPNVIEYSQANVRYENSPLFDGVNSNLCWLNKVNEVSELADGFEVIASCDSCKITAFSNEQKKLYGVQFRPEMSKTVNGSDMIRNFCYKIAGAVGDWNITNFVESMIANLREKIGDKKVLCAMSGGVDSAVAATLIHKAVGNQLTSILVDHGLMRKYEVEQVMSVFRDGLGMNLIKIDASDRFLAKLSEVTDPETKRKIIGKEFIRVFEDVAKEIGQVDYLVQGTIYPDIVESGFGSASLVKSHHNVGGLPSVIDFKEIIEPLKDLFKDEVRKVGFELGLDKSIVMRQPFPGPGLGVRCIGELTRPKLDTLRDADFIVREEIAKAGLDSDIWQYFAILTNMQSVGVRNDRRTYEYTVAIRAITSIDAMTADFARIPYDVLARISSRIVNEVKGVNRVCYDITTKPPATIEWE